MAVGETVEFTTPHGSKVPGYLAKADGSRKNVIVLQEWWGLNPQIRGVSDRFAAAGFDALAPDLYQGRVTRDPDEANHMMSGLDWVGATEQDVCGAAQYLKANGGKVAEAADPKQIKIPFQAHFANQDDWCTPAAVNRLETTLKTASVKHELFRYDAQHGFFNEQRAAVYHANASKLAWERMLGFLNTHL